MSIWRQTRFQLDAYPRGFHLVTREILRGSPPIDDIEVGLLHLFIRHTSASLAISENADPDVAGDLARHFDVLVPERAPYYRHREEGDDDMPAHIKSVLTGSELCIPVRTGRLELGTWQGVFLCEHRDRGGRRSLVATVQGQPMAAPHTRQ